MRGPKFEIHDDHASNLQDWMDDQSNDKPKRARKPAHPAVPKAKQEAKKRAKRAEVRAVSWRFKAKFNTRCARCQTAILPGEYIQQAGNKQYEHCLCPSDLRKPPRTPEERDVKEETVNL